MANYIGKIAAVGTINMSQIASGLNASARDVEKYARTVRSTIVSANSAAGRSFQEIFTPLQRLERALQAANTRTLDIKVGGSAERIRAIVGAANDIARPLAASQKQFTALSATIQNEFIGSLTRAQNAAQLAESAINRGQIKNAAGYERLKRVVDEARSSISRLGEAGSAVSGLATGRELRFQQAGFAAELQRTSALQSQASALPADARASGAVAQLVELQRREAEEAARLLAVLESVRNTRRGDAAAAQANLDAQIQRQRLVNDQLEQQISLSNAAKQARSVRDRASASETRAGGGFASLEEAQRGAEGLFSRIERLGPQAFRSLAGEIDGLASAFATGFIGPVNNDFQRLLRRVEELESRANRLREASAGLAIITPEEAAADTPEAIRQGFRRRIANNLLTTVTPEEAAADTPEAVDQRRRREVATTFLPPVIDLPPDPRQASLERTQALADRLGPDLASSSSALSRLESSTVSLKNQIDQLPAPLRAQFIPAIRQAEAELIRLVAADDALPEDIERAAQTLRGLTAGVTQAQKAATGFGGSFREFADNADIQGAAGRLQFLRQQLLRATGDTARAEEAADDLAAAFQRAANTPGGFRQFNAQLNQVEREAVEAAAAVLGVSPNRLAEQLQRAGDVSRGAFGNTGLAIQQAIFAFDDFFSVTGDLSQRIRAAGNNISQLGFIIGGTAGLVTGVLVSAFAQGAVALINWANAGVEGQDRTRALNDVLAEQQSIVDKLAESFANLGRSISLSAFSGGARDAEEFRRQIQELRDEQQEQLRGRAASLDPTVVRERALQNARRRELERTSSIGEAVLIQREIEQSRIRERAAANAAFSRPAIAPADVRNQIADEIEALEFRRQEDIRNALPEGDSAAARAESRAAAARARQQFLDTTGVPQDARAAEDLVRRRIDELAERRRQTSSFRSPLERIAIDSQAQANAQRLNALQRDRVVQEAEAQVTVIEQIRAFAIAIQQAQDSVSDAIRQGVPNSVEFSRQLIEAANAVSRAEQQFREAGEAVLDAIELPTGTEAERRDRDVAIVAAAQRQAEARGAVEAAQVRAAALEQAANDVRRRAIIDPQDTLDATLARARENLDRAGLPAGSLARDLRILQSQRDAISREVDDPRTTDERRKALDQELIAVNENIRAIEHASLALRAFSDGLNRASQNAEANLQSAQQDADEARRRDISIGTPRTRGDRESADRALARQREAQRRAEREIEIERGRLEQRVTDRALALGLDDPFGRIRDINNELASGRNLGPDGRADLLNERERLQAALQDIINQFDATAVRLGDAEERVRQFAVSVALGRELIRTEAERAGEALRVRLQAVRDAFQEQAQGQAVDAAAQQAALGRVFADDVRQVAPLRVQFGEEIANAIQQGPSRAALQVSDTTTVEGQRELNRLLRGDDPAKDINLAELQRQTRALEELVRIWRELGVEN